MESSALISVFIDSSEPRSELDFPNALLLNYPNVAPKSAQSTRLVMYHSPVLKSWAVIQPQALKSLAISRE